MEHTLESLEEERHAGGGTKEIWRVTIILSVLTVVELLLGFSMIGMPEESFTRHLIKGVIVILMIARHFILLVILCI